MKGLAFSFAKEPSVDYISKSSTGLQILYLIKLKGKMLHHASLHLMIHAYTTYTGATCCGLNLTLVLAYMGCDS